jgi:outer membrane murein-binding lipoprotein Lpp
MTPRKIDEIATDIDDASTTIDELQADADPGTDTAAKLDEIHAALEHASDALDDIDNRDERDDKDSGS